MIKKREKYFVIIFMILFFLLFALISRWSPAAGDDWGYAVGGRYANGFVKAVENYMTWSGRFLSELWGFSITPHKDIWNLLNPAIFTGILYCILQIIVDIKEKRLMILLLAMILILSVPDGLRMQTYTWMMGTTYVIPLLLFLIYILFLKKMLFELKYSVLILFLLGILNLLIPLYMENIAAMLLLSNIFVLIYRFFTNKKFISTLFVYTLISLLGVLIIRFSPGAIFRMTRDHVNFSNLSLFAKICLNWSNFLRHSFLDHIWLMRVITIVALLAQFEKVKRSEKKQISFWITLFLMCSMFIRTYAWELFELTNVNIFYIISDLSVPHSLFINTIISLLFIGGLFYCSVTLFELEIDRYFSIYLILCAGIANTVMLISPIFDSRSSIYTVYLLITVCLMFLKQIKINPKLESGITILLTTIVMMYGYRYFSLYRTVHHITIKRHQQIEYYALRPDVKDAYFLGYPPLSIHSPDVYEGDDFHMEYFKKYYYLADDVILHFYYLDDYSSQNIFAQK